MHIFLRLHFFLRVKPQVNHRHWITCFWEYLAVRSAYHLHIRLKILKSIYRPDAFFRADILTQFDYFEVRKQRNPELTSAFFWVFLYHPAISVHKLKLADTEKHRYSPFRPTSLRHLENQFSQSPERMWKHFIIFSIQNIWKSASSEKP